jgi:hypothetical protein
MRMSSQKKHTYMTGFSEAILLTCRKVKVGKLLIAGPRLLQLLLPHKRPCRNRGRGQAGGFGTFRIADL